MMEENKQTVEGGLPAEQGDYKVGDKHPPKEHQFKPGQSGNPKGVPPSRCNLWRHVCRFMNMTNDEVKALDEKALTKVEESALKIVESMADGETPGAEYMAKHFFDREEGRAVEHLIIGDENVMTVEECEEVQEVLRKNQELC